MVFEGKITSHRRVVSRDSNISLMGDGFLKHWDAKVNQDAKTSFKEIFYLYKEPSAQELD
jgi:hypothetical protein